MVAAGHAVYLGARNESRGRAAAKEIGAGVVVRLATLGPDGPTGTFHKDDGIIGW